MAIAAFVAALGKFGDDYYFKHDTRNWLRDHLTRWFFFVDDVRIPDFVDLLLRWFRGRILRVVIVLLCSLYALLIGSITGLLDLLLVSGPLLVVAPMLLAFFAPIFLDDFLISNTAVTLIGASASMWCMGRAARHRAVARRILWVTAAALIPWVVAAVNAFLAYRIGLDGHPYTSEIKLMLALAFVMPGAIAASQPIAILLVLTCGFASLRTGLRVVQWALLHIFDVASHPRNSPLTYFCALLSIFILGTRIVLEVFNAL